MTDATAFLASLGSLRKFPPVSALMQPFPMSLWFATDQGSQSGLGSSENTRRRPLPQLVRIMVK
jgi:hypothetical protein